MEPEELEFGVQQTNDGVIEDNNQISDVHDPEALDSDAESEDEPDKIVFDMDDSDGMFCNISHIRSQV